VFGLLLWKALVVAVLVYMFNSGSAGDSGVVLFSVGSTWL